MTFRIAIVSDDPGWHGARISESLQERGCETAYVRLQDCSFHIGDFHSTVTVPGFDRLPDAVFVRGVPGGSLEEVVFYLDILHALEHAGVRVYNNVRSVERSVDKGMTSFLLHKAGIPTPETWVGRDVHQAYEFLRQGLAAGRRFVLKPLFGSQGKGLQLITSKRDLYELSIYNGVYYIQEFISPDTKNSRDWRVFVIADRVLATMCRESEGWISNVAQGATCSAAKLPIEVEQMAILASLTVGADYTGVDVMRNLSGDYVVTEVNSVPAWKGLQGATQINIADCIVDHFLETAGLLQPQPPKLAQV